MSWYGDWKPYVPVAKRRANASRYAAKLAKKEGRALSPVRIEGRKIAKTFWGLSWCQNLEAYSDYANRLPRGATYVRNGSVIDLQVKPGVIQAVVSGSEVYTVKITIQKLAGGPWNRIKQDCARSITSLIDLMQGRFAEGVMQRLTRRDGGLFPQPKEIKLSCSCPDSAGMCKHVAATMYGVGARLDTAPELLFTLRDVDHLELIQQAVAAENLDQSLRSAPDSALAGSDLSELFGIELDLGDDSPKPKVKTRAVRKKSVATPTATAPSTDFKTATKALTKRPSKLTAIIEKARQRRAKGNPSALS